MSLDAEERKTVFLMVLGVIVIALLTLAAWDDAWGLGKALRSF